MRRYERYRSKRAFGQELHHTREVFSGPLLRRKRRRGMDQRDLSIVKPDRAEALIDRFRGFGVNAEFCTWSIRDWNAGPTEQSELLFDGVCLLLSPKQQRRRRLMIVKLRVLIGSEADAMWRPGRSRQKRRGRSTVKVVNDVVIRRPELARDACARHEPATFQRDHVTDVWMIVEQRRDPVFDENVDLCLWQEPLQREDRRRGENCVANRSQANQQDLSRELPVPARRRQ